MFKIRLGIINDAKGAVVNAIKGTADISSTIVYVVKNLTVNTLNETGD